MKLIKLTIAALLFFALTAGAQTKPTAKAIIKVPALTCEPCKDRIEQYLFKAYGIAAVKADFKKHTVAVTWITDRTNLEEIKTAIANAGFDADDVTAEEAAAKRIPPCCKKVEEVKPLVIAPTPVVVPTPVVEQKKVVMDTVKKVSNEKKAVKKPMVVKK
jgi:periplasmic mercuric ion binding protein